MSTVKTVLARRRLHSPTRWLAETYIHLTSTRHSARTLAAALGVSTATAFRAVQALRRRGIIVESMKEGREWYFEVRDQDRLAAAWKSDPLLRKAGFIRGRRRPTRESVDDVVYGPRRRT